MAQENETKILNIDFKKLERKLSQIGAVKAGEVFFRSISFDFPGFPLDKDASWIRLRDDGKKVTLAYKKRLGVTGVKGQNDSGMEEIEIIVSSYEDTISLLKKIGMIEKFSQEKKRITWKKGSVTFDIDTWPRLNTYLEIEGENWTDVDATVLELGFDLKDKVICSATQIDKWVKRDGSIC
jgi:adenylate cyclase class 2